MKVKLFIPTRKSSCVNARGILPAVYWVLLLLSYLGTPPPVLTWLGTPPTGYPPAGSPQQGTPQQGTPCGRVPSRLGTPPAAPGRVPPWCLPHGILGNVAKHYGIWVPPPVDRQIDGWMDGQTRVKTLPSRCTTYTGGNNHSNLNILFTLKWTKVHWEFKIFRNLDSLYICLLF